MDEANKVEQSPTETQPGMDIVMPSEPEEDPILTKERAAFSRYVQEQGEAIPPNFKSADEWFNSLRHAQTKFTQGQQEIAALKKQYSETGVQNPNYDPQAEGQQPTANEPEQAKPVDVSDMPDELSISKTETPPPPAGVSQEDWEKWGREIDINGNLTEVTRQEIATRLKADPIVVDQLVKGRQAMKKQAFEASANVVGGADNLKRILKWAGDNLPQAEVEAMNRGLQTDASQSILLGLKARHDATAPPTQEATPEPSVTSPNAMQAGQRSNPGQEVQAFVSEAEMKAAISDPRYRTDPLFRQAVGQRIIISSQHGYRQR